MSNTLMHTYISYFKNSSKIDKKMNMQFLSHIANTSKAHQTESWAIAKMTTGAPYIRVQWKFSGVPDYTHGYFSRNFKWAFVPIESILNVLTKLEVRSFTPHRDNRVYPKNLGSPWICPRSLFSKILNGLLFGWALWMFRPNLKFVLRSFTRSCDNSIGGLGGGCEPPILGKRRL